MTMTVPTAPPVIETDAGKYPPRIRAAIWIVLAIAGWIIAWGIGCGFWWLITGA